MSITEQDTAGASGAGEWELPSLREHVLRIAMSLLGSAYERAGVRCDYDLSLFPAPALKWERKDPKGFRATFMVSQAACKMGFHGRVSYHRTGEHMGTQATKDSLDYYLNHADPAYIALMMIYRGIEETDPGRAMEALDFADEWIGRMVRPQSEGRR